MTVERAAERTGAHPRRKVDILFLAGTMAVGGTERHLSLILPGLARRGWRVEAALLGADGPMSAPIREAGAPISFVPEGRPPPIPKVRGLAALLSQSEALAHRLREDPPRVLHCFLPTPCIIGAWAARKAGFRPIVMSRRSQSYRPALFFGDKWLERLALHRADKVLGHSNAVLQELMEEGVAEERLALVHNGIIPAAPSDDAARARMRQEFGAGEDEVLLVVIANFQPYKGHEDLLQALARLRDGNGPPVRVALVGSGPADRRAFLQDYAEQLGVDTCIAWVGETHDVTGVLAAGDVGVLPSHQEGFSNAALEIMNAGLPLVATATGGNLDVVVDGETGRLVAPSAPEQLAAAILDVVEDPVRRREMGRRGRALAQDHFTLDACLDGYDAVYRELLGAARNRGIAG